MAIKNKTPVIKDVKKRNISVSIATIESIIIGDIRQYVMVCGVNCKNPILLFLHRVPGFHIFHLLRYIKKIRR